MRLRPINLVHCLCANAHEKGISNLRAPLAEFSSCDLSLHGDIGSPAAHEKEAGTPARAQQYYLHAGTGLPFLRGNDCHLSRFEPVKPDPFSVTTVPTGPEAGEKFVMPCCI